MNEHKRKILNYAFLGTNVEIQPEYLFGVEYIVKKRTKIIPNGIDIESYNEKETKFQEPTICSISRLTPKKRVPLIFDIDVFREQEYASNIEEMWNGFEDLKAFKNQIFFNTITDKCKELFR